MKKAPMWLALLLVAPALTVAQEKYTNADLARLETRQDAYTNADLDRLPPQPGQSARVVPLPPMPRDAGVQASREEAARRAAQRVNRDLVLAEIDYWQDLVADAHHGVGSSPNGHLHVGGDTAEARRRVKRLQHLLHMMDVETRLAR